MAPTPRSNMRREHLLSTTPAFHRTSLQPGRPRSCSGNKVVRPRHSEFWPRLPLANAVLFIVSLMVVWIPLSVSARINVVALPARDSVQLTIYNSVDLTLVKATRVLTFRRG